MIYVGTILDGYCNGYFGRDSYGEKKIEAVGADWIVVREEHWIESKNKCIQSPDIAIFDSTEEMEQCVENWIKEMKEKCDYNSGEYDPTNQIH